MSSIPAMDLLENRDEPVTPDAAKALVMAEIDRLVVSGLAAIVILEAGTLELRLATGEVFHLGEETITRIAVTFCDGGRKFEPENPRQRSFSSFDD